MTRTAFPLAANHCPFWIPLWMWDELRTQPLEPGELPETMPASRPAWIPEPLWDRLQQARKACLTTVRLP